MLTGRYALLAFARPALDAAWEHISRGDDPDDDRDAVSRFAEHAGERLDALAVPAADLADARYQPGPLRRITLRKSAGGVRYLDVPPVRDRIVSRAILGAVTARIDPLLGPACYGFRPGLGVADAVQAV